MTALFFGDGPRDKPAVAPANLAVARQDGLLRCVVVPAVLVGARPDGRLPFNQSTGPGLPPALLSADRLD